MVDVLQYKVGVILSLEGCGNQKSKTGKALKACRVDVGSDSPIMVVTSASNVRVGSRVIVAPEGSTYLNAEGTQSKILKTSIGGVVSEGMFCDSRMLGWSGGGVGVAAQVPESSSVGSSPPATKPRQEEEQSQATPPTTDIQGLFEKKLSKEEKKKLADEKRQARRAAKAAKSGQSSLPDEDEAATGEEQESPDSQ